MLAPRGVPCAGAAQSGLYFIEGHKAKGMLTRAVLFFLHLQDAVQPGAGRQITGEYYSSEIDRSSAKEAVAGTRHGAFDNFVEEKTGEERLAGAGGDST